MKRNPSALFMLTLVLCLALVACGNKPAESTKAATKATEAPTKATQAETQPAATTGSAAETQPATKAPETKAPETKAPETTQAEPALNELIEKIQGASDDSGIYAFIVTLSNKAADKGSLEYLYYGPKGSAQENEIVCTFTADYYKEESGTFDIRTYYDGQVNTHLAHKSSVKVDNTFGATVRAGLVIVSYTPDGGEKQEIYRAAAEQFKPGQK